MINKKDIITVTLEPQLYWDSNNEKWGGQPLVMEYLGRITSRLGILDWQLYELALAEYIRNKDIYDMEHNYGYLLTKRLIGLAAITTKYTSEDIMAELTTISDSLILRTSTLGLDRVSSWTLKYYDEFGSYRIPHPGMYPMLPLAFLQKLETEVISKVKGMIYLGDVEASKISIDNDLIRPLMARFELFFYANWEVNSHNPIRWTNKIISILYKLDYGTYSNPKSYSTMAHDILTKGLAQLSQEGNYLNVSPTRAMTRLGAFIKKLNNLVYMK